MLAEFLAIFAGIVLGLLADDWRQSRDDVRRESEVLREIVADLEGDSAELASIQRRVRAWNAAGVWVTRNRERDIAADSAMSAIAPLQYIYVYRPQRAAYAGLRDAAELNLIRDSALRRQVVEYFEVRQPYIETLYGAGGDLFSTVQTASYEHLSTTLPAGSESLRDRLGSRLREPWSEASSDHVWIEKLIGLGVFGATVALRTPVALEDNRALREAIVDYLQAEGSV